MKKIKVLILLAIFTIFTGNAFASTIDTIEAIDNNTIELTASEDVIFSDVNVVGNIKLLKDIPVSFSTKDPANFKKIVLNLSSDLTSNTSYSLITILGADGNIDFNIGDYLEGESVNDNLLAGEKGLEKVNIIDSRTMELYFTYDLTDDIFEFKILSEIKVDSLKSEGNNKVRLEISKNLEKQTAYIIMILSIDNAMGTAITLNEDLYDLVTPANLIIDIPEEQVVIASSEEQPKIIEEGNVVEVALDAAGTPETGTATGILVILAIILNLAFFLRKKFIK